ncbi:MAG: methyltransferase [Thermodesulfobacteriota bacterium]
MKRFPEDFLLRDGVWHPLVEDPIAYSDGDAPEAYLRQTLEGAADLSSCSRELQLAIRDWPSEYHLSPLRANILRPLGIGKDARVLELGCGCGAVTRYLGESAGRVVAVEGSPVRARLARMRCRELDNVEVVACNFDDMDPKGPFDIVTLIGVLEYAGMYWRRAGDPFEGALRFARGLLAPDGVLVVAIENRLGMKYFSGCTEDHLGKPFSGIEGYPAPGGPRTFGRRELVELAERCGLPETELLLPFPDYKLPSSFLNARFASARECREYNLVDWCGEPFRDYTREREHHFSDQLALCSAADAGLLPEFSNSFLLLAAAKPIGADSPVRRPDFVAQRFNLLRSPEFRTVTTLAVKNGAPVLSKARAGDHPPLPDSPVTLSAEQGIPFIPGGRSLFLEMLRAARRDDGGEELVRLVARWVAYLRGRALPGTELLPPDHIDCQPGNLILDPSGALRYIDDEWRWHDPVPMDWVLYRGLFDFWHRCRQWVVRFLPQPDPVLGDFIGWALPASGASIGGERLEELANMEKALQSAIFPFRRPAAPLSEEEASVARVEELFGAGELLPALTLAGDIAKRHPRNATNWNNLGVILNRLEKTDEARECLRIALSLDPGLADASANLEAMGEGAPATKEAAPGSDGFRVVAIVAAYNEGDVIRHAIGDLIAQGIEVYLIDNCSTDDTVAQASAWLGKGLIRIERFPDDAGYPAELRHRYAWKEILRRKEEVAATLRADWFIHHDADEFRESPWPGLTLKEAIRVADAMGYNALQFAVFNFKPVDDGFVPGTDVREHMKHYLPLPEHASHAQVKAWKNLGVRPEIVESGGHDILFEGRRIFPTRFLLRHYPVRGQRHGEKKVFEDRKRRFSPAEREHGWHRQYDHIEDRGHDFLCDPAGLHLYDPDAARLQILSYQTFSLSEKVLGEETVGRLVREGWYDRRALRVEREILKIW